MGQVLLFAFFGSLMAYPLSKLSVHIGPLLLLTLSLYALFVLFNVPVGTIDSIFGAEVLRLTPMGRYFAIVSLIIFAAYATFNVVWVKKLKTPHAFNALSILTFAGTLGSFLTTNLIALFVFWEIAVIGTVFLVPMGKEEAKRASIWYIAMMTLGSAAFLFATFMLYGYYETFDLLQLSGVLNEEPSSFRWAVLILMLTAGIAKSGVFPLHAWLRNVHGNAPDSFSAVLSGQLVKMGSYLCGLLLAVFPVGTLFQQFYGGVNILSYILIWLGNISILVGTLMAIKQNDMKMLIAYSTVANSGYILIGLSLLDQAGFASALFHVFNHALSAAMIFLAFAAVIYRTGTSKIDELGGLIHRMPVTFITYLLGIIALAGIPPTSGFISKWMLFHTLLDRGMFVTELFVFLGSIGSFLYVFRPLAGVFLGQLKSKYRDVEEVPLLMQLPMVVLVALVVLAGVLPQPILSLIAEAQRDLGIEPFLFEGTTLIIRFGESGVEFRWDTWTVFIMFAVGFFTAALLYIIMPKGRKIPLEDQYTSGEFIHNFDLYHYSSRFYAFFEREYEGHPSFEGLYASFANFLKTLGSGVRYVASLAPAVHVLFVSLVLWLLSRGW